MQKMKDLFVTEDANAVMEQFEKEKNAEIEGQLGSQVKVQEVKKGWNEWAGEGVSDKRHQEKVNKAEAIKRKRIEDLKKQRSDHRMKGVVVNSEDRDKKFAHKYLIKELPHNYGTVDQYQKIMNVAVGKEWTTL